MRDGNGSAGDLPYGYSSDWQDPAAAAAWRGRPPKPKRVVVIDEKAAELVREVFRRFVGGESMTSIVTWWNENLDKYPPITRKPGAPIRIDHVRGILHRKKYIGYWKWGDTTMIYDGHGNGKAIPARPDQVALVERPTLRIVDQQTWDKAQLLIAKLNDIYGMKADGTKRGPAVYYRLLYEQTLLGGKVTCGLCGSRMVKSVVGGEKRLICPKHRDGRCPMNVSVPYERAENAVLETLSDVLKTYPAWLKGAADAARERLTELAALMPSELAEAEAELQRVSEKLNRLVDAVAEGHVEGPTVRGKMATLETRKAELQAIIGELRRTQSAPMAMPDDAWIARQLHNLAGLLQQELSTVARELRPLVATAVAEQIKPAGFKLGYPQLRFTIDGWAALVKVLGTRLSAAVLTKLENANPPGTGEFTVPLGRQTCSDQWGPIIAGWRQQGDVTWEEIGRRTGLKPQTAWWALQAYMKRHPK